jgi:hypothetical protein
VRSRLGALFGHSEKTNALEDARILLVPLLCEASPPATNLANVAVLVVHGIVLVIVTVLVLRDALVCLVAFETRARHVAH